MANIKIEITEKMAYDMVIGTGGPSSYSQLETFASYGALKGFPNESWQWNTAMLKALSVEELLSLYHRLTSSGTGQ